VARHQLVELATARDVLVLEQLCLARLWGSHHRGDHFIVIAAELGSDGPERTRNHGKAVSRGVAVEGCRIRGTDFARDPVDARRRRSLASNGPELVRQMLLDERNLRLHGELDNPPACKGQDRGATPVRIQAGRFWYITPRVPSIGSTMMTHRAVFRSAPSGTTTSPPGSPSATSSTGSSCVAIVLPISATSSWSATRSIGVDRIALSLGRDP